MGFRVRVRKGDRVAPVDGHGLGLRAVRAKLNRDLSCQCETTERERAGRGSRQRDLREPARPSDQRTLVAVRFSFPPLRADTELLSACPVLFQQCTREHWRVTRPPLISDVHPQPAGLLWTFRTALLPSKGVPETHRIGRTKRWLGLAVLVGAATMVAVGGPVSSLGARLVG